MYTGAHSNVVWKSCAHQTRTTLGSKSEVMDFVASWVARGYTLKLWDLGLY